MGDREFFRTNSNDVAPLIHPVTLEPCRIGECELDAAMLAIPQWSRKGVRNILLFTDSQNVLCGVETAKSNAPEENRVSRALNLFCLHYQVDVSPVYLRSEHNIIADDLTRWSEHTVDDWSLREGMARVNEAEELRAHMSLPYNARPLAPSVPGTFAMLAEIMSSPHRFNRYRVCEWRPINYVTVGLLGNWDAPSFFDQLSERDVRDILVRSALQSVSFIDESDGFLLVGCCKSWDEIVDLRRSVSRRLPLYADMFPPNGTSDNSVSDLWASAATIDSAITGGPLAAQWAVYCSGGIQSAHFDLRPTSFDIRSWLQSYRSEGLVFEEDRLGWCNLMRFPLHMVELRFAQQRMGQCAFVTRIFHTLMLCHSSTKV